MKWALGSDQSSVRSWPCAANKGVVAGHCAGRGCALIRQLANSKGHFSTSTKVE